MHPLHIHGAANLNTSVALPDEINPISLLIPAVDSRCALSADGPLCPPLYQLMTPPSTRAGRSDKAAALRCKNRLSQFAKPHGGSGWGFNWAPTEFTGKGVMPPAIMRNCTENPARTRSAVSPVAISPDLRASSALRNAFRRSFDNIVYCDSFFWHVNLR